MKTVIIILTWILIIAGVRYLTHVIEKKVDKNLEDDNETYFPDDSMG